MSVLEIPPPVYEYPTCSLCGTTTHHDGDGLRCADCRVGWDGDGTGFRLDDDIPPCDVEHSPFTDSWFDNIRGQRFRCVRNTGHDSRHAGVRIDQPGTGDTMDWANTRVAVTT